VGERERNSDGEGRESLMEINEKGILIECGKTHVLIKVEHLIWIIYFLSKGSHVFSSFSYKHVILIVYILYIYIYILSSLKPKVTMSFQNSVIY
jgi:hypothetical protein